MKQRTKAAAVVVKETEDGRTYRQPVEDYRSLSHRERDAEERRARAIAVAEEVIETLDKPRPGRGRRKQPHSIRNGTLRTTAFLLPEHHTLVMRLAAERQVTIGQLFGELAEKADAEDKAQKAAKRRK